MHSTLTRPLPSQSKRGQWSSDTKPRAIFSPVMTSSTATVPLSSQSPMHGRPARAIVASTASAALGTGPRPPPHSSTSNVMAALRRTLLTPKPDKADRSRSQCRLQLLMTTSPRTREFLDAVIEIADVCSMRFFESWVLRARKASSSRREVTAYPSGRDVLDPADHAARRLGARVEKQHQCAVGWQFKGETGGHVLMRSGRVRHPLHGATIRLGAATHDGTDVRLRLESGERTVPGDEAERRLTLKGFCLDLATEQLLCGDEVVALTAKAFTVLRRLVEDGGQLVTKEELLRAGWAKTHVSDGVLKVSILEIAARSGTIPRRRAASRPCRAGSTVSSPPHPFGKKHGGVSTWPGV
jgi:hypothetical protein